MLKVGVCINVCLKDRYIVWFGSVRELFFRVNIFALC